MRESLNVVRRHCSSGTLLDGERKISATVLNELGGAGYWGLLVATEYGGSGAEFTHFAQFLTRVAMFDPTVAGLASVHGCFGAVDPVRTFGTPEQKTRFLPRLASGQRLSAFALTEPCVGSDLTALRTQAVRADGSICCLSGPVRLQCFTAFTCDEWNDFPQSVGVVHESAVADAYSPAKNGKLK